ncbi:hypothetical protein C5S31_00070 [ANME-1 cluster archaeon GoMg2]|nr:hypothetical protein [ANME-1 cluster archaeon GoMg2]
MDVITQLKGMTEYKRYVKTLILSTALAVLMLYIALGLMFFASVFAEVRPNPVPGPYILLIFAIFFIIFTVFYESRGKSATKRKDSLKSLIRGAFLAICATIAFVATIGGVILTIEGGTPEINMIISALAVCMIVSMVFLSMVKHLNY